MPRKISNISEAAQIVVMVNTKFLFNPCSITKRFWGPIANIRLPPVKKPSIKFSILNISCIFKTFFKIIFKRSVASHNVLIFQMID